jgi:hypothetical protein
MVDATFKHPFRCLISGPSSSGKTQLLKDILLNKEDFFSPENSAKYVFFYYNIWQPTYKDIKSQISNVEFIQGTPSLTQFEDLACRYMDDGGSLFIIDDGLNISNKDLEAIFTTKSHHCNASVIYVTQNLFAKTPEFRLLSLNSQYIFIMKNPRDSAQVSTIAGQISLKNRKLIEDSYKKATEKQYSYLLLDLHQSTPDDLRLKSNIFPPTLPIVAYVSVN